MESFNLEPDEVLVIHIDTGDLSLEVPTLYRTLSIDEQKRAGKFLFERDRNTFIITRGVLRKVLGTLLKRTPSDITFQYGEHGKPELEKGGGDPYIYFNISHTRGKVLIAVTHVGDVGIDIEYIRSLKYENQIPERFFAQDEFNALRALPENLQQRAFFTCWARKESFIKAKGGGLRIPLKSFSVSVVLGQSAQLLRTEWDSNEASQWSIYNIDVGTDYTAFLSVKGKRIRVSYMVWGSNGAIK